MGRCTDNLCKYFEEGECTFMCMGSGNWMDAPCYDPDDENEESTDEKMTTEVYCMRLDHYFDDGENRIKIEEPLVVKMIYDRSFAPASVCLNRMLDMMRDELLRREGEG